MNIEDITFKVKKIEFDDGIKANENANYPDSGFFLTTVKKEKVTQSDLRFVDKSLPHNICIAPASAFYGVLFQMKEEPTETEIVATIEEKRYQGQSDNDFILQFSQILLNKK